MKTKSYSLAAALASIGAVAAIHAAAPAVRGGGGGGGMIASLRSDMNVTDAQRQAIRQVMVNHRDDLAAVARPLVEANRALCEATLADAPDADAIRAAADRVGKGVGDAAVLVSKMKGELKDVFTPEQLKTLGTFEMNVDDKVDAFLDRLENGGK